MNNADSKAARAGLGMVLILGTLASFGPLSLDMYLPALPEVAADLHTTASLAQPEPDVLSFGAGGRADRCRAAQ